MQDLALWDYLMELDCSLRAESPSFSQVILPFLFTDWWPCCGSFSLLGHGWKEQRVSWCQLDGEFPPSLLTLSWVLPALCSASSGWLVRPNIFPVHWKASSFPVVSEPISSFSLSVTRFCVIQNWDACEWHTYDQCSIRNQPHTQVKRTVRQKRQHCFHFVSQNWVVLRVSKKVRFRRWKGGENGCWIPSACLKHLALESFSCISIVPCSSDMGPELHQSDPLT